MNSGSAPQSVQQDQAWWRRFGRRNLCYIALVVLLIPFGMALQGSGADAVHGGHGIWTAFLVWCIGSLAYFVVNAVLLVSALARDQPVAKPLIACALPFGVLGGVLLAESLVIL